MSTPREFAGKNVEAAMAEAEARLGRPRDELEIEIITQGSRGVFGIGGEPARIRARDPEAVDAPNATEPAQTVEAPRPIPLEGRQEVQSPAEPAGQMEQPPEEEGVSPEPAESPRDLPVAARDIVSELLTKMGFDAIVTLRQGQEPVTLDVTGDQLGVLIGRRGESLAALQFMVNVILSKRFHEWPRVIIDVQGYRARREQSLNSLGQRVAERVRRNRRPFTLEAMAANDRRIIHLSLKDRSDVETYSIGEGPARRVVIAPRR